MLQPSYAEILSKGMSQHSFPVRAPLKQSKREVTQAQEKSFVIAHEEQSKQHYWIRKERVVLKEDFVKPPRELPEKTRSPVPTATNQSLQQFLG